MITVNTRSAKEEGNYYSNFGKGGSKFYDNYEANAPKGAIPLDYRNIFIEQGFKKEGAGHYTKQLSVDFTLDAQESPDRKYVTIMLLKRGMLPLAFVGNKQIGDTTLRSLDSLDPNRLGKRNLFRVKVYTPEQVKETLDNLQKVFEEQSAKASISSEHWKDEALFSAFQGFSIGKDWPTHSQLDELVRIAVQNPDMPVSEIHENYFNN